jgi:hypothetical protein
MRSQKRTADRSHPEKGAPDLLVAGDRRSAATRLRSCSTALAIAACRCGVCRRRRSVPSCAAAAETALCRVNRIRSKDDVDQIYG